MDLTQSITPRSDQFNADDLIAHPITVTIANVTAGTTEQPVNVELVEYPGRPYKPSKSMRRVLVAAWGAEASTYRGRRLTLFRNPDIKFGGIAVGGIEIAAMSHIDKPVTIALTTTRGKRKDFTLQPLTGRDWTKDLEAAGDDINKVIALGTEARAAGNQTAINQITARYNELKATNA